MERSFFIQMANGSQKGIAYGGRFLWRLILLLIIGYSHSLFYRGDSGKITGLVNPNTIIGQVTTARVLQDRLLHFFRQIALANAVP